MEINNKYGYVRISSKSQESNSSILVFFSSNRLLIYRKIISQSIYKIILFVKFIAKTFFQSKQK